MEAELKKAGKSEEEIAKIKPHKVTFFLNVTFDSGKQGVVHTGNTAFFT